MSNWFYYNEKGEKISVTGGQLKGLAKAGVITPDTIVETEEGKSAPARKVKGLTFQEPASSFNPFTEPATSQAVPPKVSELVVVPNPPQVFSGGHMYTSVSVPTIIGYCDPRNIAILTIISILPLLFLHVILILCDMVEILMLSNDQTEWDMTVARFMISIALFIASLVSGIIFLFWTYRVVENAHRITMSRFVSLKRPNAAK
jgi:hypothetical protein